jgi:hypothetical protein
VNHVGPSGTAHGSSDLVKAHTPRRGRPSCRNRPEPADIEEARSRSHGPAAERRALGLREPESTHRWTGTACRAAPLACSDWSEERDAGLSRLDRVDSEGGGDNGNPGRTGRHLRVAVTRVLICAVGALVITRRDIISRRFTLSLFKGLSRDQRTNLRSCYNERLHDYIGYTNRILAASYVWVQTLSTVITPPNTMTSPSLKTCTE